MKTRVAQWWGGALVVGLALGVAGTAVGQATSEGTVGGPLHAEMYPSGLETADDGTVVIADTGNNEVARYAADGTQLWRVGGFGDGVGEFDNPRDVGVDSNGNVYVSDTRNSRIVKLDRNGNWLSSSTGPETPYSFQLGVSVRGDKVYVADTGRHRVVVTDLSGNVLQTVVGGTFDGLTCKINDLRDAQADSAGNIYVAGYKTNEILKFSSDGTCVRKWGGTGSTDGKFRTPYGVDLAVDPVTGDELVYVADGLNDRVQVFTRNGTYVTQFGTYGEPDEVGTFTTMRRVAVATDGSGDVWAADLWGNRIERWKRTATGYTYAQTVGAPMPAPTSTAVFHEPRGMAFTANGNLLVADTVHHGIQQFDANGAYVRTCGLRAAEGSQLGQFNWPRGIAVDPGTGNMWVADTKQHQLQVLTAGCQGVGFVKNLPAASDARSFNWPYDIAIRPSDRFAFVVDTQNHRIKAYDVANAVFGSDNKGPQPTTVFGSRGGGNNNFKWPSGVTTGPDGSVYVADRGNNRVTKFSYSPGAGFTRLAAYTVGGTLNEPEGVAVDSSGRIYIADSSNDRVVVLNSAGVLETTITGLQHPANLEIAPDGKLYVADTYADRVRVYSVTSPAPDTQAPTGTITSPSQGASVPNPVTLTGTATDDSGIASVKLGIKRGSTGQWWNGTGWQSTAVKVNAVLAKPNAASTTWSYTVPATLPAGGYGFSVDITDTAAKAASGTGKPSWRSFTVSG